MKFPCTPQKRVLVTGGLGFIGSNVAAEFLASGYDVHILDNLSNSQLTSIDEIYKLVGSVPSYTEGDILDYRELNKTFIDFKPDLVIHLAGLKSVEESFSDTKRYFKTNVVGTQNLLKAMEQNNCNNLIFSSSATLYGNGDCLPYHELSEVMLLNPYAETKFKAEEKIVKWSSNSLSNKGIIFRYFNPIGANKYGLLSEFISDKSSNIIPKLLKVAKGQDPIFKIYGNNFNTIDGTGERDYVHVVDLARAHVLASKKISKVRSTEVLNLGTGKPTTVKQLVNIFETVLGRTIAKENHLRRPGDSSSSWTDISKAKEFISWEPELTIRNAISDCLTKNEDKK